MASLPSDNEYAAWNRVLNVSGFSSDGDTSAQPLAAPMVLPTTNVVPPSDDKGITYYVRFTLPEGETSATFDGSTLYQLSDFSFGDTQALNIGSSSGGSGAGKVAFGALSLTVDQTSLSPALFSSLASGSRFAEVDIVGYDSSGSLASEYSFGLVAASKLTTEGIQSTVQLQYGSESIRTYSTANGVTKLSGSGSWDRLTNTSGFSTTGSASTTPKAAATQLPTTLVSPLANSADLKYTIDFKPPAGETVDGLSSTTLYQLTGFSTNATQTLNIGSASGGAGAGKVTFNPLTLSFTDLSLTPALFQLLASATSLEEADLFVSDAAGAEIAEYSFKLVYMTELESRGSGVSTAAFEFGSEQVSTYKSNGAGGTTLAGTGSWSQITNQSDPSITGSSTTAAVAASTVSPAPQARSAATSATPLASATAAAASGLTYYVRFTLSDGATAAPLDGSTLYQLTNFTSEDERTVSLSGSASGGTTNKVTYEPLELSFTQPTLIPALFRTLASGSTFQEIDVLGYDASGDLGIDYSYGNAAASELSANNTGVSTASFQYGSEAIRTYTTKPGSTTPVLAGSGSWNRVTNTTTFSGADVSGAAVTSAVSTALPAAATSSAARAAPLTLPTKGVSPTVDNSDLTYSVTFIPYVATTSGAFETGNSYQLSAFSFDDTQTVNIGSASSGAGAGKVAFNPLSISFSDLSLLPTLFQTLASGQALKEVDIVASDASGQEALEYRFGLVGLSMLGANQTGVATANLEFGSEAINTYSNVGGVKTLSGTGSWNRVNNVSGFSTGAVSSSVESSTSAVTAPNLVASTPSPTAAAATSSATHAVASSASTDAGDLTYYVRFTLPSGAVSGPFDGQTLYQLSGFDWEDTQTLNIGSASSGVGAGKVTFNPLELSFTQASLVPSLFQMLASGSTFSEVDVLGYDASGDLAQQYDFGLVAASDLTSSSGGPDTVSLQYGSQRIQSATVNPDGTLGPVLSGSWNRVNNVSGFSTAQTGIVAAASTAAEVADASAAPPTTLSAARVKPASSAELTYYVRFTLPAGAAAPFNGSTLYQLSGFSSEDSQTLSIGSGVSGAGAGKVTFNGLTLTFTQSNLTPALFQLLAAGTAFKEVDVLGYDQNDSLNIDYSFGLVGASGLQTSSAGQTQATLQYGSEAIRTFAGTAPPIITPFTAAVIEQGQTTSIGTVSPGIAGDALKLTQTGGAGAVTLGAVQSDGSQLVIYTAPSSVSSSEVDAVSYTVTDPKGNRSASGSSDVQLDGGPSIASATPSIVEQGQTTIVGVVTPGLSGDTLTLSQTSGAGTLSLGVVQTDGTQDVVYTAPTSVTTSEVDAISYTVADQHKDVVATGANNVQLDGGPTVASETPSTVEIGQTTDIGLVTPGLPGDTLTLTQTSGVGTLSLGAVQANGAQQLIYTAPATIAASVIDNVTYSITDEHQDATAMGSIGVQLDAGPTIATATPAVVEKGQTTIVGIVTPGLTGDTLKLTQTAGSGTLSLGAIQSNGTQQVVYTAPTAVATSAVDAVTYTVSDQHDDVVANGSNSVQLDSGPTLATTIPALVEASQSTVIGTVEPGLPGDTLTVTLTGGVGTLSLGAIQADGSQQVIFTAPTTVPASLLDAISYSVSDQHQDAVALGTSSVPIAAGEGTLYVGAPGHFLFAGFRDAAIDGRAGHETIFAGDGNDTVFAGPNDLIWLGDGADSVIGGSGDTIRLGNGADVVSTGAGANVSVGDGSDMVTVGDNSSVALGRGLDTVVAGANANISGDGGFFGFFGFFGHGPHGPDSDSVTAGPNAYISLGDGVDAVTAGAGSYVRVGDGEDTVTVGDGSTIFAGNGNDTLTLGSGDTVAVGHGHDVFIFTEANGVDHIAGFDSSRDVLNFSSINPHLTVEDMPLSGGVVAADSIAWLVNPRGGDMVYVNDTSSALSTSSTGLLTITLDGVRSGLSAHDFVA